MENKIKYKKNINCGENKVGEGRVARLERKTKRKLSYFG